MWSWSNRNAHHPRQKKKQKFNFIIIPSLLLFLRAIISRSTFLSTIIASLIPNRSDCLPLLTGLWSLLIPHPEAGLSLVGWEHRQLPLPRSFGGAEAPTSRQPRTLWFVLTLHATRRQHSVCLTVLQSPPKSMFLVEVLIAPKQPVRNVKHMFLCAVTSNAFNREGASLLASVFQ